MNQHGQATSDLTIERTQKALDDATSHLNPKSATGFNGLDGAENFVAQTTQQVGSVHDFYTQNATVIKSVSDVMVADLSKIGAGDFLGEAKKVMDALDVIQQIHPFVGVAILAFKGVLTLELKRRDNNRKVGLVLGQASDMMIILLQLKGIRDPAVVGPHGEIRGRLDRVLDGIKKDIKDCGNTIDKFYKSKFIVQFFRSSDFASEFLNICNRFTQRREDLILALNLRTMLRVDIAIDKLDKLMNMQSEREARFEKEVQKRDGRDKCFESDDKLLELQKIAEQQEARLQNKGHSDAPSKDFNKAASTLDASLLLHELHASFGSLLDENRALFMFKLDKQTSDITDAIKDSETRIIWAFNSSFRRVKDQHLRYIWKEMKWTTSVKTQYFIAELHDYYTNHFARLRHEAPYPQATSDVSSLVLRVPSPTPTVSVTSNSEGEDHELPAGDPEYHRIPAVDPADKWFLKYMTVFYLPSLSEGFDSDANGLISVREVNAFTSAIPSGWSLPQALAYSAAGWRVDSQYYHRRIEQVLNSMVDALTDVLPENRRCIVMYLDSYISYIKRLVRSIGKLGSEDSDLDLAQLTDRRREAQEETLAGKLNIVKYEIDSADSIKLFGSGRIENFLLPVLYLVIRRHLQIMKLASTVILVDRELECATQTIENILGAVNLRVEQLAESFRQQGTDPKARFTWYAHGLYNFWYSPELVATDDTEYWVNFGVYDTELEIIDPTALKLGPFSLGEGDPVLDRPTKLVAIGPDQQPGDTKDEYIRLSFMNKLQNLPSFHDIPPYLSPKDIERLDNLSKEHSSDVPLWDSLAELQMRGRLFECGCDGCNSYIIDVLRRCADCESDEYDLCADCESLPVSNYKNPGDHKPTHNLLVFRMSLPSSHYKQVRWYARNLLSTCMPAPVSPEGSLTAQEAESETSSDGPELPHSTEATQADVTSSSVDLRGGDENISGNSEVTFGGIAGTSVTNGDVYACAECGVKMKGIFYVCLTCGELYKAIALCDDCAFRDEFQVATEHHPHKHWLIKIKGKIQDADGTTDEPVDDSDETSALAPLSSDSPADNLAAMVESRFAELDLRLSGLDLRLSGLVTQVDQLVHNLAGLTGKAQLPVESVNGLVH